MFKLKYLLTFIIAALMFTLCACAEGGGYAAKDGGGGSEAGFPGSYSGIAESFIPGGDDVIEGIIADSSRSDALIAYSGRIGKEVGELTSEDYEDFIKELRENNQVQSGQLTAKAYFDNDHYDFWRSLLLKDEQSEGAFAAYTALGFNYEKRVKVLTDKYTNATLNLVTEAGDVIYTTQTTQSGVTYLFAKEDANYKVELVHDGQKQVSEIVEGVVDFQTDSALNEVSLLDIMFVIDATGSMGDEIAYLKSEIISVIEKIKEKNQNVDLKVAVLMYRDFGDDYVTRLFDFTSNPAEAQSFLSNQFAAGGGDFEEAVDEALLKANQASWRENAVKLAIHVADAPAHDNVAQNWETAVMGLAKRGVRIINVASSGIDKKTEYYFRSQCMLTNGCYTYLTNDSGIGGDHLEATVDEEPTVELLKTMLVRLVDGYYNGTFAEPIYYLLDPDCKLVTKDQQ